MKRPITPASEAALLGLYRLCALPNDYICAARQNILEPAQFSDVFFQKLIKQNNIIFKSTNLAGKEEQLLELRVDGFEHLQDPPKRFGDEGKNILIHGGELPRFDFILGYTFIQVSISNFQKHNEGTAAIDLAFTDRKYSNGRNQIEYFLDYTYGGTHRAEMEITEVTKKTQAKNTGEGKSVIDKRDFKVTRDGVLCPDFMILYIRGKNDFDDKGNEVHRPNHTGGFRANGNSGLPFPLPELPGDCVHCTTLPKDVGISAKLEEILTIMMDATYTKTTTSIEASKSFPKDLEPKIAANNPVNPIEPMLSAQHKISIASLTRRALPAPVLEEMLSSMILDMLNGSTMNKPSRAMHAKSVLPTLQTVADLLKDNEYGDDK
ncbi:hypothetical protein BCR41DRAFT_425515 [Lobosporangium transversale]|uniref:Uncharacterized protein n=1 Tax=Lobosporangium transversale TaxID=64571 RepID=A0A1Y2GAJ6_9FUNG|nr:hypothetical protein BCR41DRAFT_425515 [Lobosporangium transversale]ORZ05573.1 hypothetical protein BCR41DRAFT_425515 [Lobosporangium transversale]|eukprot:XP_021877147.1 hypothetical protein BCR41DRAFT_425515 [Lobosporangium transversale]